MLPLLKSVSSSATDAYLVFVDLYEGYEKLAQLRGEGTSVDSGPGDDSFDMFAKDDEKANVNPAPGESDLVSRSNSNDNNQPSESVNKYNNDNKVIKCRVFII
ncbi:hypothetical protein POM88_043732 [Heracleum sosnowskyi]|uniref:Uncharacterized protein n=1 Tax=Heracleum sosnowskyi TaxID=360622 RepID=A0AAD8H2Y6_9APIA|nr:hypothetical protein POM88_043732 [Heracleum sosnowskyi]